MSNPIENIKTGNENTFYVFDDLGVDSSKYNDYQNKLIEIQNLITEGGNPEIIYNLINNIENIDSGVDKTLSAYFKQLGTASLSEIPNIKSKIDKFITEKIKEIQKLKDKYDNEKNSQTKTTRALLQLNRLTPEQIPGYIRDTKNEINGLFNDINKIVDSLNSEDSEFGKKLYLPDSWDKADYMENELDKSNVGDMTYESVTETINYFRNFINQKNNLRMQLPGLGSEGTIQFSGEAEKLAYCKIFLTTLKEGLQDIENKTWPIWLGIGGGAAILTGTIISKGIKYPFKGGLWLIKLALSKIKGIKKLVNNPGKFKDYVGSGKKETKVDGQNETETKTKVDGEGKVEGKGKYMTKERATEIIDLFEKKYIDTIKQSNVNSAMKNHLGKLRKFIIENGKYKKIKEIQLGTILDYLYKYNELPYNYRGKFARFFGQKPNSNISWHEKGITRKSIEWTGEKISKISGKNIVKVPKEIEIQDRIELEKFINELGKNVEAKVENHTELRNSFREIIKKYKENVLSKINDGRYSSISLGIDELSEEIRKGNLDNINKNQFTTILNFLDKNGKLLKKGDKLTILGNGSETLLIKNFLKKIEPEKPEKISFGGIEIEVNSKIKRVLENINKSSEKLRKLYEIEEHKRTYDSPRIDAKTRENCKTEFDKIKKELFLTGEIENYNSAEKINIDTFNIIKKEFGTNLSNLKNLLSKEKVSSGVLKKIKFKNIQTTANINVAEIKKFKTDIGRILLESLKLKL